MTRRRPDLRRALGLARRDAITSRAESAHDRVWLEDWTEVTVAAGLAEEFVRQSRTAGHSRRARGGRELHSLYDSGRVFTG